MCAKSYNPVEESTRDLQDTDNNSTLYRSQRRQSTFTAGSASSRRHSSLSECSNITITHASGAQKHNEFYSNYYLKCKGRLLASPVYENTYRLSPTNDQQLNEAKIKHIVDKILEQHFMPAEYDGQESKKLCLSIASLLLEQIKPLDQQRFKLVCIVSIVSDKRQGVLVGSRCLWNGETDHCISINKRNSNMIAVVTVYGMYYE